MKHTTKEVIGCKDCPFLESGGDDGLFYRCNIKDDYMEKSNYEPITPTWCPLKEETITIVLKEN